MQINKTISKYVIDDLYKFISLFNYMYCILLSRNNN